MKAPKQTEKKLRDFLKAWKDLASGKTIGDLTLAQAEEALRPSFDSRSAVTAGENLLISRISARETADKDSLKVVNRLVNAIKADATLGEDSDLYEAVGYVRASKRRTGKRRNKSMEPKSAA
ncbi:MAG TPA: hypothetical protein VGF13_08860 [Verrucomicrobiae bacterium]|jgi:hypothetical protein